MHVIFIVNKLSFKNEFASLDNPYVEFKRILYTYYLRDFNLASIELPIGMLLSGFGLILGAYSWIHGIVTNTTTQTGTLVLIAISILLGLQLILAFLSYDTNNRTK